MTSGDFREGLSLPSALPGPGTAARPASSTGASTRPRSGLLAHIADNNIGQAVSQGASLVRLFLLAHLLGPDPLGLWAALLLVAMYGANVQLGLFDGMNRLVPLLRGQGSPDAERLKDVSFTATLGLSAILGLAVVGAGLAATGAGPEARIGLAVMGGFVVLYQLVNYQLALERFRYRFAVVRNATALRALSDLALSAGLAPAFGIHALFVGLAVSHLATLAYLLWKREESYRLRIDGASVRLLLGAGLPILLSGLAFTVLTSVDRLLLVRYTSPRELGYYGLGLQLGSVVYLLPTFAASVLYIRFLESYGRARQDASALRHDFERSMLAFAVLAPVLAVGLQAAAGLLPTVLPAFTPGLAAIRIAILASCFLALAAAASNLLVALGRARLTLAVQAVASVLGAGLGLLALRAGWGLEGVALATLAAYAAYATAILLLAARLFAASWAAAAACAARWYLPFGLLLAVDLALDYWLSPRAATGGLALALTSLRSLAILAVATPFVLEFERRTGLLGRYFHRGAPRRQGP